MEWINASELLPKAGQEVLLYAGTSRYNVDNLVFSIAKINIVGDKVEWELIDTCSGYEFDRDEVIEAICWMPLLELPKWAKERAKEFGEQQDFRTKFGR
jgi:hypothetical protein